MLEETARITTNREDTKIDFKEKIKKGRDLFYNAYKKWEFNNKWGAITDTIKELFDEISSNIKSLENPSTEKFYKYSKYNFELHYVSTNASEEKITETELQSAIRDQLVEAINKLTKKFFTDSEERENVNCYLFNKLGFEKPEDYIKKGPYLKSMSSYSYTLDPSKLEKHSNFSNLYTRLKEFKYQPKNSIETEKNDQENDIKTSIENGKTLFMQAYDQWQLKNNWLAITDNTYIIFQDAKKIFNKLQESKNEYNDTKYNSYDLSSHKIKYNDSSSRVTDSELQIVYRDLLVQSIEKIVNKYLLIQNRNFRFFQSRNFLFLYYTILLSYSSIFFFRPH